MYVPMAFDVVATGFDIHAPPSLGRRDSSPLVHTLYRDGAFHGVVLILLCTRVLILRG